MILNVMFIITLHASIIISQLWSLIGKAFSNSFYSVFYKIYIDINPLLPAKYIDITLNQRHSRFMK